jgi:hypothetical protein
MKEYWIELGQARVLGVLSAVCMLQAMLQVILRGAGSARRALRLVGVMLSGRYALQLT